LTILFDRLNTDEVYASSFLNTKKAVQSKSQKGEKGQISLSPRTVEVSNRSFTTLMRGITNIGTHRAMKHHDMKKPTAWNIRQKPNKPIHEIYTNHFLQEKAVEATKQKEEKRKKT
jgi:hypothetical protein